MIHDSSIRTPKEKQELGQLGLQLTKFIGNVLACNKS